MLDAISVSIFAKCRQKVNITIEEMPSSWGDVVNCVKMMSKKDDEQEHWWADDSKHDAESSEAAKKRSFEQGVLSNRWQTWDL